MKQVILCSGCDKIKKRNGCYTANLSEEVLVYDEEVGAKVKKTKNKTVKLCRVCYIGAGYKPRGAKEDERS